MDALCPHSGLQCPRNPSFPRGERGGEEGHLQRYVWRCQDFWLPHQGKLYHHQCWAVSFWIMGKAWSCGICIIMPFPPWLWFLFFCPARWLVYAHPFFQGLPRVLEVGGYSNPAAWGVEQPYVGSLHPLKVVSDLDIPFLSLFYILFYIKVYSLIVCSKLSCLFFHPRGNQEWRIWVSQR